MNIHYTPLFWIYIFKVTYKSSKYYKCGFSFWPIERMKQWEGCLPVGATMEIIYYFGGSWRRGNIYTIIGPRKQTKKSHNADRFVRQWFFDNGLTEYDGTIYINGQFFSDEGLIFKKDITDDEVIQYCKKFINELDEFPCYYGFSLNQKEYNKFLHEFNNQYSYINYSNDNFIEYIEKTYGLNNITNFIEYLAILSLTNKKIKLYNYMDISKSNFIDESMKKELSMSYEQIVRNPNQELIQTDIINWLLSIDGHESKILDKLVPSKNIKHGIIVDELYNKLIEPCKKTDHTYIITNCFEIVPFLKRDFPDKEIIGISATVWEAIGFELMGIKSNFVIFNPNICMSSKTKDINAYFNYINNQLTEMGILNDSIIIANPPYSMGNKQLIYPRFYSWAIHSGAKKVCMIFPTTWLDARVCNGLGVTNTPEIKQDKQIVYIDMLSNVFKNVPGAGKVNIVCWEKDYDNGLNGSQKIGNYILDHPNSRVSF